MTALRSLLLPLLMTMSLGLGFAGPAQACAFCGEPAYRIVNVKNWASLRATPSTRAARLAKVPLGEQVIKVGPSHYSLNREWINVWHNGETGWIPADYLAYDGIIGQPNSGGTNASSCGGIVRARPDMGSRKVRSLREGQRVEILSGTGVWMNGYEWFHIDFDGRNGYQWGGILSADDQRPGSYVGC